MLFYQNFTNIALTSVSSGQQVAVSFQLSAISSQLKPVMRHVFAAYGLWGNYQLKTRNSKLKRLPDAEKDAVIVFVAVDGVGGDAYADPQGADGRHVAQLNAGGIFELP